METLTEDLKAYIAQARNTAYSWGYWDCQIFVTQWHDFVWQTNTTGFVQGKYDDKNSAMEYLCSVDNPVRWLKRNGYSEQEQAQTGDVIIHIHDDIETAWLFCNDLAYTMSERGLIGMRPRFEHTIWRKTCA